MFLFCSLDQLKEMAQRIYLEPDQAESLWNEIDEYSEKRPGETTRDHFWRLFGFGFIWPKVWTGVKDGFVTGWTIFSTTGYNRVRWRGNFTQGLRRIRHSLGAKPARLGILPTEHNR